MAALPLQKFGVFLEGRTGETLYTEIRSETPALAAIAAENSEGGRATAVIARMDVAGRCVFCGAVVFASERPNRVGKGIRCRDC